MSSERVRSLFAVAAGFAGTNILSLLADSAFRSLVPHAFDARGQSLDSSGLLLTLLGTGVCGAIGGYITARIATRQHVVHAAALGIVTLVFGVAASILTWSRAPAWFHLATLAVIVPAALLGGVIRVFQLR
jgi:predicted MFS family arabinose efflux permease